MLDLLHIAISPQKDAIQCDFDSVLIDEKLTGQQYIHNLLFIAIGYNLWEYKTIS